VAGIVAVSSAAGFCGPMGAVALGFLAGAICLVFCALANHALVDESIDFVTMDLFIVYCAGGVLGTLATAVIANPAMGGTGAFGYAGILSEQYDLLTHVLAQIKGVALAVAWSGFGTAAILFAVDMIVGLHPLRSTEGETEAGSIGLTSRARS
jgi:ammonium transporter, Amt family